MNFNHVMKGLWEGEKGAIGWVIVGIVIGVILVIWLIARIIGGIF